MRAFPRLLPDPPHSTHNACALTTRAPRCPGRQGCWALARRSRRATRSPSGEARLRGAWSLGKLPVPVSSRRRESHAKRRCRVCLDEVRRRLQDEAPPPGPGLGRPSRSGPGAQASRFSLFLAISIGFFRSEGRSNSWRTSVCKTRISFPKTEMEGVHNEVCRFVRQILRMNSV